MQASLYAGFSASVSARALNSNGPSETDLYQCGTKPHRICPNFLLPKLLTSTLMFSAGHMLKLGTVTKLSAIWALKISAVAFNGVSNTNLPHTVLFYLQILISDYGV